MANDTNHHSPLSLAQRKTALIEQGANYRTGVKKSKRAVQANLHVDVLAKSAAQHFLARSSMIATSLLSLKSLRKGNFRALLPLLTTGVSALTKRGAVKPMLRGAAVLAALGAGAFFLMRKKKAAPVVAEQG
jgi:hypothetical protein